MRVRRRKSQSEKSRRSQCEAGRESSGGVGRKSRARRAAAVLRKIPRTCSGK